MIALGYYEPVHKLSAADSIEFFDCDLSDLNQFLQRYALVNQKANSAKHMSAAKMVKSQASTA